MTKLYLTALKSLETIEVDYIPKKLQSNRTADYATIKVVGRNNPLYHYTSGQDTMSLELDFYAKDQSRQDVIAKVKQLESWAMNDGYMSSPEVIRLTFGRLFKYDELWIIDKVDKSLSNFDGRYGNLPKQAYVKLSLKLDPMYNRERRDVVW